MKEVVTQLLVSKKSRTEKEALLASKSTDVGFSPWQ